MPRPYLTGRNTDYLCVFALSDEWDGLTKYATFYNTRSEKTEARLLSEGMCRVPYAVLTYGDVEIGVVGKNGKEAVKSSTRYTIPVEQDAAAHDDEIIDPSGDVFEQIIAKLALLDRGIQSAHIDNGHLYIYLTNDERIDCGSIESEITGHNIEFAFVNALGELILVRTNGEQVNCGAIGGVGFPEITANDEGKVLQIVDGAWALVPPQSGLPDVTALQNGQVLTVVDGEWAVDYPGRILVSAYINNDGELVLVFADGEELVDPTAGSAFPAITANDENKILRVVNGQWALVDLNGADVLPAVTAADDGKILQVIDGAWQTVEADLTGGVSFTVGNGLKLENGVLSLDMASSLSSSDSRPVAASTVATQVETVAQDAVDASAMSANDVNDLFAEIFP